MCTWRYYSNVLFPLNLLNSTRSVRGYDEFSTNKRGDSTWIQWICIIFSLFISLLLNLFISLVIAYYQRQYIKSVLISSVEHLMNKYRSSIKLKKERKRKTLLKFQPLTSYEIVLINQNTSIDTVDKLIVEARRTNIFILYPYRIEHTNTYYLDIQLISSSASLTVILQVFHEDSVLFQRINMLLSTVFHTSNIIQVWGSFDKDILDYQLYQVFSSGGISQTHFVDIQNGFKDCYNRILNHNRICCQILDIIDIDGPMCSCSHRPCKHSTDQRSISNILAHTLNEKFAYGYSPLEICLAITKLYHCSRKMESAKNQRLHATTLSRLKPSTSINHQTCKYTQNNKD